MRRSRAPEDPQSATAAYTRALRWLMARELSEGQVRAKLRDRGFDPPAISTALDRLRDERAIDDRRTAAALARTEARVRRHGPRRILAKLAATQIDRELAAEVVRELFSEQSEADLIEQTLERRLRSSTGSVRDAAERRRLVAYLVRQGFSVSAAAAVLRRKSK